MSRHRFDRTRDEIVGLAQDGLDWVTFSTQAAEALRRVIPFVRCCWHPLDPGTVLFTGTLCESTGSAIPRARVSGTWIAEHEYLIDDVNQYRFLARSGRRAGSTGIATHGDLSRCARNRSVDWWGDELRGAFVADGINWGAASFVRERDDTWFTEEDVRLLASLSEPIAKAFRRALVVTPQESKQPLVPGPGVVVFDNEGKAESISPAAEHWIEEIIES
ncbi:MAG: LuxR family transcriptional regulator, partial [Actinobacteria bacterium]|nr:LuxR family transcriptional regulator [Actinomycetota bacterium]